MPPHPSLLHPLPCTLHHTIGHIRILLIESHPECVYRNVAREHCKAVTSGHGLGLGGLGDAISSFFAAPGSHQAERAQSQPQQREPPVPGPEGQVANTRITTSATPVAPAPASHPGAAPTALSTNRTATAADVNTTRVVAPTAQFLPSTQAAHHRARAQVINNNIVRCRMTVVPYDRLAVTDDSSQALARAASQQNMRILGQQVAAAGRPLAPASSTRRLPGAGLGPGAGGAGTVPRASSSLGAKEAARLPVMDGTGQGPVVSPWHGHVRGQGQGQGQGQQRGHGRRLQSLDASASLRRALTFLTADHDHHHDHATTEKDDGDSRRRRRRRLDGAGRGHMGQHQGRRGGAGNAAPAPVPVPVPASASGGPRDGDTAMEACLDRYHRHIVAKYVPNELSRPLSPPLVVLSPPLRPVPPYGPIAGPCTCIRC